MKKVVLTAIVCLLIGTGIGYLLFLNTGKSSLDLSETPTPSASASPDRAASAEDTDIVGAACKAAELIKAGSYAKLAEMVHPEDGVYFSPYSDIDLKTDMHFTAEQTSKFSTDGTSYMWGYTDGEGAPINLTPKQFFEKYVFDEDYTNSPVIGRNYIVKSGNSIENVKDVFPDCEFVEFHFPGFDSQYEGMDWRTLRLVFKEYEGTYKIVAIVHDQWTI
jgi:hypothetical protein